MSNGYRSATAPVSILSPGVPDRFPPKRLSLPSYNRILVVRTDRIGDVVLATPLFRALRRSFPRAWISAMVRPYAQDVLKNNPHINEVLLDDPERDHAGIRGFVAQVLSIRRRRFDVALILLPKSRLSWMLFLAGIPLRVGEGIRLDHVLTFMRIVTRKRYVEDRHEADYCLDLGRKIGVSDDGLETEVFVTTEEGALALNQLMERGAQSATRLIGIHPFSGKSAPNWRIHRYKELAGLLLTRPDIHIVVTGSAADAGQVLAFEAIDPQRVTALHEKTLRETIAVLSKLEVLISPSTGPMHLAAGLKVPTVSLFCPLKACSPRRWGPTGNHAEVVLPPEGFCQNRCPGDPHVCEFEGGIFPRDVFDAVEKILAGRP